MYKNFVSEKEMPLVSQQVLVLVDITSSCSAPGLVYWTRPQ